jgi:hypothetical protein
MSFVKILFIIWVLSVSASQVSALDYKSDLPISSTFNEVSENNISAAKLLQDYVESYEEKINSLLQSYQSENTEIIDIVNSTFRQMSRSLDIIQYKSIDPLVVNSVMKSIVWDLKIINNKMKIYLEQERQLYRQRLQSTQDIYIQVGIKISTLLDHFVSTLSYSLVQKQSLSQKEKEIVRSLVVIRTQSNKIKDFKNKTFDTKKEMKAYFQNIVISIKSEIISMK